MKNRDQQSKQKLPKKMRFVYGASAVGLIVIGIVIFSIISTARLNAKLNAIRAAGYPTTITELNNYYPAVAEIENAAKIYEKAFLFFRDADDKIFKQNRAKKSTGDKNSQGNLDSLRSALIFLGNAPTPVPGEKLSKVSNATCQEFVNANSKAIATLKQATKITKCRFPSNLKNGFIVDYANLARLTNAVKLLAITTILAAEAGDDQLAVENILAMLKISLVTTEEPFTMAYLTKISLLAQTIQVLEYANSIIKFNDNSLQRLCNALESNLDADNSLLNRALAGSRVINIEFKHIARHFNTEFKYQLTKSVGIGSINKLRIIKIYDKLFILDKNNLAALQKHDAAFSKQLQTISSSYFLVNSLTINPTALFYKNLAMKAQINGAIISLAIERFQQKYHKLPKQLNQLVPEFIKKLPNDPFSGKAFRYVIGDIELPIDKYDDNNYPGRYKSSKIVGYSEDPVYCIKRPGWMVYSYGRDQDDDNGVPMGFLKPALNGDITFRCVRRK